MFKPILEKLNELSTYLKSKGIDSEIAIRYSSQIIIEEELTLNKNSNINCDNNEKDILSVSFIIYDVGDIGKLIDILRKFSNIEKVEHDYIKCFGIGSNLINLRDSFWLNLTYKSGEILIFHGSINRDVVLEPVFLHYLCYMEVV